MVVKPNDVTTFGGEALFKNEPRGEEIVDQPTVILTGVENENDEERGGVIVSAIDEPTMILTPVEEEAKKAAAEITTNNQESILAPPPPEPQQPKNEMPPPKIINSINLNSLDTTTPIEHNLITPLNDTNISVMSNERDQFDGRLPNARDLLGTSFANQNDSSNILFF